MGDSISNEEELLPAGWAHSPLEEPLDDDGDYEDSGESALIENQMDDSERDRPALRKELLVSGSLDSSSGLWQLLTESF